MLSLTTVLSLIGKPNSSLAALVFLYCLTGHSGLASASPSKAYLRSSPILSCKAVPGSPDWPAPSVWAQFNESVGGRLLQPTPPGAVCHPGQPTYDAAQCTVVQSEWSTYEFHRSDPVSVDNNQWNNDTCLPLPAYPCSSAGYPAYVVNASSAEDVQAAVLFAGKHNVRLIVKGSGHDYLGRSSGPHSLSIWTNSMKGLTFHKDYFRPKCCNSKYQGMAVTARAGTDMVELQNATALYNQTVVGGGGRTVGVGGYTMGAGHGLLSAQLGMAADQVLEMEIVTPQGEIKTLNECQNRDLFWAMRGGGGSTFGVLTSLTIKTHTSPTLIGLTTAVGISDLANPHIWDAIAYTLSQYPRLADAGMSGYSFFSPNSTNLLGGDGRVAGIYGTFVLPNTTNPADAISLWQPIFDHINATYAGDWQFVAYPQSYASYIDWYDVNYDHSQPGADVYVGSRLLDKDALTANLTASIAAYKQFAANGGATAYLVSGPGSHNAKPPGGGNSINPGWRTAYVHATNGVDAQWANETSRQEAIAFVNYTLEGMRTLSPKTGAYINEADPYEPNWQTTFWGDNYPRLLDIKRRFDPNDVLWCHTCVGSERWQLVGDRVCRVSL